MKTVVLYFLVLAALVVVDSFRSPMQRPSPNQPGFPTFPGQGPFNPRPPPGPWGRPRFRRAPEDDRKTGGSITGSVDQPLGGQPSASVGYQHTIYASPKGSVDVFANAAEYPGQPLAGQAGINGQKDLGHRYPGSITGSVVQPLGGQQRQPSVSVGYERTIYQGPHGHINTYADAVNNPGRQVEGQVGIRGQIYFQPRYGRN